MEQKFRELTLTEIIARNEHIPVDKVDEWVERCLIYANKKGIIRYESSANSTRTNKTIHS